MAVETLDEHNRAGGRFANYGELILEGWGEERLQQATHGGRAAHRAQRRGVCVFAVVGDEAEGGVVVADLRGLEKLSDDVEGGRVGHEGLRC